MTVSASRPRVALLCTSEEYRILLPRLSDNEFDIIRLADASPTTLLHTSPEVLLACLNQPKEISCLRRAFPTLPIVICSPRTNERHVVLMLEALADDYLSFSCGIPEMQARLRVQVRHARTLLTRTFGPGPGAVLALESQDQRIRLDLRARTVSAHGRPHPLTPTEYAILRALMSEAGTVIPSTALLSSIWGQGYGKEVEYLRVYIHQIRHKLETNPARPRYIETITGTGYRFRQPCQPIRDLPPTEATQIL